MAASPSSSSPSPLDSAALPPNPSPLLLPPPSTTTTTQPSSRRLPPPCWSPDETTALIDAYRDKWYSLRRGNLKASHWQDVADAVRARCPTSTPPKTAVQCRHKMEKLRKRYRTEIQRARSIPVSRFNSSWVHFSRMDAMEKGPSANNPNNSDNSDDDNDEEDEYQRELYEEGFKNGNSNSTSVQKLYRNGIGSESGSGGGFRIKIPTGVSIAQPGPKNYAKFEQKFNPNPNPNFGSASSSFGTRVLRECNSARAGLGKRERDPVTEMVAAIKVLGDGFVKMEKMKMDMAREMETMRMEMEMKRTEMILDSQQRIVEAFAKAVSEKKKPKRMPSPES